MTGNIFLTNIYYFTNTLSSGMFVPLVVQTNLSILSVPASSTTLSPPSLAPPSGSELASSSSSPEFEIPFDVFEINSRAAPSGSGGGDDRRRGSGRPAEQEERRETIQQVGFGFFLPREKKKMLCGRNKDDSFCVQGLFPSTFPAVSELRLRVSRGGGEGEPDLASEARG